MDPRNTAEAYLAALSAADVDRVLSLVTDDFVNEHTSELGSGCRGRDEYGARLPGFLGPFAALHYEVIESITEGSSVSVRYRMTANFDGHPIDIPGVMLFSIDDGLVARRTDVWDSLTFLRQTGAVEDR